MASDSTEEKKADDGAPEDEQNKKEEEEEEKEGGSEKKEEEKSSEGGKDGSKDGGEGSKKRKGRPKKVEGSRKSSSTKGAKKLGDESRESKSRKKSSNSNEPVTPNERPTRERRTVERYSALSSERVSVTKGLSIEKGRGAQLKDIPNVAFKLSKRKPDENLQLLHAILFGRRTKNHNLKRNINQFSGFVWVENEEKQRGKIKEKLDKCIREKLLDFCNVLDIPVSKTAVKKEELTTKLLEFLESPHATTEVSLAEKEESQKGKKRKRNSIVSPKATSKEAFGEGSHKKQKRALKTENKVEDVEYAHTKGKSDEKEEDDDMVQKEESDQKGSEAEEEEEKPKEQMESKRGSKKKLDPEAKTGGKSTPVKKGTPAKSAKSSAKSSRSPVKSALRKDVSADERVSGSPSKSKGLGKKKMEPETKSKKHKSVTTENKTTNIKHSSMSGSKAFPKDKGKSKAKVKTKSEPSREEMHAVVANILKEVDFNTATLSDIIRQLGEHFGMDLMHKKVEVKSILEDVINTMTDEEEEDADEGELGPEEEEDKANDA